MKDGTIIIREVLDSENVADLGTKSLDKEKFERFREKIGIQEKPM